MKPEGAMTDIDRLVEKAPRFAPFAEAIKGGKAELSDAQRAFLDNFAAEIAKRLEDGAGAC